MNHAGDSRVANRSPVLRDEVEREQDTPWTEGETVAEDDESWIRRKRFQVHGIGCGSSRLGGIREIGRVLIK